MRDIVPLHALQHLVDTRARIDVEVLRLLQGNGQALAHASIRERGTIVNVKIRNQYPASLCESWRGAKPANGSRPDGCADHNKSQRKRNDANRLPPAPPKSPLRYRHKHGGSLQLL